MREHGKDDFFFLDQSFPFLVKTAKAGERRCAIRVSEYELVNTALSMAGMIDWVWVDCFTRLALSTDDASRLRRAGFRLCLVSPELQGRDRSEIATMKAHVAGLGIYFDAVCTKAPNDGKDAPRPAFETVLCWVGISHHSCRLRCSLHRSRLVRTIYRALARGTDL